MSESYIIEANRNDAIVAKSNAEYTCKLAKPIIVNPGDQVNLKMASIDSKNVTDADIIVTDDTQVSIVYSLYDVDYAIDGKKVKDKSADWRSGSDPTFDYYAVYNDRNLVQVNDLTLKIVGYCPPNQRPPPAPNSGGTFVIDKSNGIGNEGIWFKVFCRYLDASGLVQETTLTGNNARKVNNTFGWISTGDTVVCQAGGIECIEGTFEVVGYGGRYPSAGQAPEYGSQPAGIPPVVLRGGPIRHSDFKVQGISTTALGTTTEQLDIKHTAVTIRQGTYDPNGLAIYITQLLNDSQGLQPKPAGGNAKFVPNNKFLQRTDAENNTNMLFRLLDFSGIEDDIEFNNANSYRYSDGTNPLPYYVGASQFSLDYGSAGQIFSLNYAHMPLENEAEPKKQAVGIFWTGTTGGGDLEYHQINQASGIVIHDLQPRDFWEDKLGLYSQLIVPLGTTTSTDIQYYRKDDMLSKITYGYASLDSFLLAPPAHTANVNFRKMDPIPPSTTGSGVVYIDVTGQTRALIGESTSSDSTGGYYLLEVTGLPSRKGGYVDDDQNRPQIMGIISKQYTSNNVITGFADSGLAYTNWGLPQMISELSVRILDENKNLVTDLGSNNAIFLEIVKAVQSAKSNDAKSQNQLRGEA